MKFDEAVVFNQSIIYLSQTTWPIQTRAQNIYIVDGQKLKNIEIGLSLQKLSRSR